MCGLLWGILGFEVFRYHGQRILGFDAVGVSMVEKEQFRYQIAGKYENTRSNSYQ